jgi:hypothetical protein
MKLNSQSTQCWRIKLKKKKIHGSTRVNLSNLGQDQNNSIKSKLKYYKLQLSIDLILNDMIEKKKQLEKKPKK